MSVMHRFLERMLVAESRQSRCQFGCRILVIRLVLRTL